MKVGSRALQKKKTIQRLLSVSFDLIAERGALAFNTVEVAKRAGVAHGTVFAHFPRREDLVIQVVELFGKRMVEDLHKGVGVEKGLRKTLKAHLNCIEQQEDFYRRLVLEGPLLSTAVRQVLLTIQSAVSFHVFKSAETEMREGRIKEIPMHLLFNQWSGLLHYYLANADLFSPGTSVIREKREELLNHFITLLTV